MKNMNRRTFLEGLGLAAGTFSLAACGGNSSDSGTDSGAKDDSAAPADDGSYTLVEDGKLTVVAELGFAPFEYMDEKTGEPEGFDVDFAKALGEAMGLETTYLPNQKFDTLVPTIKQGGKADVAIAAITINDERAESIDFTDPYLDSNQSIVCRAGSGETEESLNDASKTVCCQSGTTGDEWISENLSNATKVPLDDVTAALTGIQTGSYDAMVVDLPVSQYLIKQSFSDLEVVEEIPTGEQYGVCVSKDNPNLTAALNEAIAKIKSDGTMDKIETEWFGTTL